MRHVNRPRTSLSITDNYRTEHRRSRMSIERTSYATELLFVRRVRLKKQPRRLMRTGPAAESRHSRCNSALHRVFYATFHCGARGWRLNAARSSFPTAFIIDFFRVSDTDREQPAISIVRACQDFFREPTNLNFSSPVL